MAITVTDGFIAGQAAGFNVQLVGTYVDSPLTWAVSAHPESPYKTIEEMFQQQGENTRNLYELLIVSVCIYYIEQQH